MDDVLGGGGHGGGHGDGGWARTLRNFGVEAKRSAERATVNVMKKVGISAAAGGSAGGSADPEFDYLVDAYVAQSVALRTLRDDAVGAFEALARTSSAGHTLAVSLAEALPANAESASRTASDALSGAQIAVADEVLRRVERRVNRRVLAPLDDEIALAKDVQRKLDNRRKIQLDVQRYRARLDDTAFLADNGLNDDARKLEDKANELNACTRILTDSMSVALPRRAALVEACVAETIEFQRRFFVDAGRAMDRAVELVGTDVLAAMRGSDDQVSGEPDVRFPPGPSNSSNRPTAAAANILDEDLAQFAASTSSSTSASRRQEREKQDHDHSGAAAKTAQPNATNASDRTPEKSQQPQGLAKTARTNSSSIWDEAEDDGDDASDGDISAHDQLDSPDLGTGRPPVARPSSYPSGGIGSRESTYPSAGVGSRESAYPSTRVGGRESTYPSAGVGARESLYPPTRSASATTGRAARPPNPAPPASFAAAQSQGSRRDTETGSGPLGRSVSKDDVLDRRPSRSPSPGSSSVDDLLGGLEKSSTKQPRPRKSTSQPVLVDDIFDFGSGNASSSKATGTAAGGAAEGDLLGAFEQPYSRQTKSGRPARPTTASSGASSAPSAGRGRASTASTSGVAGSSLSSRTESENLDRGMLKKQHEAEILARADEKLAAVRDREDAEAKEREDKDKARAGAERRINSWTGNGTRRGNLRALLAALDTVLYPSSTWQAVTLDVLATPAKVKVNYHKAILQVHPDKIGPKNLPPEQQVLAELIFDELRNGHEVWTAEQEGRPPPPGSVGPKNAQPGSSSGFGGMNMNAMYQQNMGRGMGGMGGMGGMNGMGGMGGMGAMGSMGGMGPGRGAGMGSGLGQGMGAGMPGYGFGAGRGAGNMSQGMYGAGRGYGTGVNNNNTNNQRR